MGRPSPPAWLYGRWQVMSRPCHSGMGAQVEATQGGCVLATAGGCGGEGSDVCPHAISQRGWGQHARPRQTSAASWKPKPPASCWPVVRLKVSCCSVSRPATTCISHISCPLLSKLHRAGQHCRRKPLKKDTRRAHGSDITPHGTQLVVHLPEGRKGIETEWPLTQNLDAAANDV